jgi:hypothetical protein
MQKPAEKVYQTFSLDAWQPPLPKERRCPGISAGFFYFL